jgi:hypothetical protein
VHNTKFVLQTKYKNGKYKNKFKVRVIMSETKLFSRTIIARILGKNTRDQAAAS